MEFTGKKVVLIIASEGFQEVEYGVTKKLLENEGIEVITASNKPGGAIASDGTTANVDITLEKINPRDYDGIFWIGGPGALEHLDNATSYHLACEAKKHEIPYGAICIAPRILAKAYALQDKKATGWNGDNALETIFKSFGVVYTPHNIVTDDLVVTASGPEAASQFAEGIIRVLTKKTL